MRKKAVVLLSGGLDSSVNLFAAAKTMDIVLTLTFNYGQRAAEKEISRSAQLSKLIGTTHKVVDVTWFRDFKASSLIQLSKDVPTDKVQIDNQQASIESAKSVWVPNRNGILLNIAAGFAESLQADYVIPGFNAEEAATFPDNSTEYMRALDQSFQFSTSNQVRVHCLTDHLNKTEIVKLALQLQVPIDLLWPCYFSFEKWCGQCESCQRSKRAMKANGISTENFFLKD